MEKAEQVRMMGDIYERAESVYIWLGEEEEQDQHVLEMTGHICRLELVSPDDLQGTSRLDSPSFKLENYPRETFVGMSAFLHWPWFWRAWVLQEYHRARNRVFRCGALIIPCETLSGTIEKMDRYFTLKSLIVGFGQPHRAAGSLFNSLDTVPSERSLIELLAKTSGLLCSDKRVQIGRASCRERVW